MLVVLAGIEVVAERRAVLTAVGPSVAVGRVAAKGQAVVVVAEFGRPWFWILVVLDSRGS